MREEQQTNGGDEAAELAAEVRALVDRARQHDLDAYDELVSRYQKKIYALVYHMTSSREDTEDLVQDVFVKAYRSLALFKGDSSFYTWIYRIAVNRTRRSNETPTMWNCRPASRRSAT